MENMTNTLEQVNATETKKIDTKSFALGAGAGLGLAGLAWSGIKLGSKLKAKRAAKKAADAEQTAE